MNLGVISGPTRTFYFRELKGLVAHCMRHRVVGPLRRFCRSWIRKGAPIDPRILHVPRPSLEIILRQLCVALSIEPWKWDALLWLTYPECRSPDGKVTLQPGRAPPRPYEPSFIAFNLCLYAPKDTPYAEFNARGLTLQMVDDPTPEQRQATLGNVDRMLAQP